MEFNKIKEYNEIYKNGRPTLSIKPTKLVRPFFNQTYQMFSKYASTMKTTNTIVVTITRWKSVDVVDTLTFTVELVIQMSLLLYPVLLTISV